MTSDDVQTGSDHTHNYCLEFDALAAVKRTRLFKSQGGNPDSRVFPQKQREAQWPPVSALGPGTEHRGDL